MGSSVRERVRFQSAAGGGSWEGEQLEHEGNVS